MQDYLPVPFLRAKQAQASENKEGRKIASKKSKRYKLRRRRRKKQNERKVMDYGNDEEGWQVS